MTPTESLIALLREANKFITDVVEAEFDCWPVGLEKLSVDIDAMLTLLDSCVICEKEPVGVFTYSPPDFSVGISSGIWEELADGYNGTPLYRAMTKVTP